MPSNPGAPPPAGAQPRRGRLMRIGDIDLVPIDDGELRLPQAFYAGLDFASHQDLLAPDGTIAIPVGCFLLRTRGRTMLLDAGQGPDPGPWGAGGGLPPGLAAQGVAPEDIDTVVLSHLH